MEVFNVTELLRHVTTMSGFQHVVCRKGHSFWIPESSILNHPLISDFEETLASCSISVDGGRGGGREDCCYVQIWVCVYISVSPWTKLVKALLPHHCCLPVHLYCLHIHYIGKTRRHQRHTLPCPTSFCQPKNRSDSFSTKKPSWTENLRHRCISMFLKFYTRCPGC